MCDTFVALPEATADGSVILGKNSDREPNEAHHLLTVPAAHHRGGEMLRATHRTIAQARHTHAVLLAKPYWIWGAEMGVNEHGVAIGNEALFTTVKHEREPGLLGMDLLRLGLERGGSAEEAAQVICDLLAEHGQSGQAGHSHKLQYHNSFIIADPAGALVLETVGRDWVIQRVDGSRSISNALTIADQWDAASPGFDQPRTDLARKYSDVLFTRFSEARTRQCRTSDELTKHRGTITVPDAMRLLRDHGEPGELGSFTPASGLTGMTVCAHASYGPIRVSQSVGSMVAQITPTTTTVWLTATSAPCLSVFKPVWLDAGLPDLGPTPGGAYDVGSLWWRHENLHRAVLPDYAARAPIVQSIIAELEDRFFERAAAAEPSQRRAVSAACFAEADAELAPLLPRLLHTPITHSTSPLYGRAWRGFDRQAQR